MRLLAPRSRFKDGWHRDRQLGRGDEARSELNRIRQAEPRWAGYLPGIAEVGMFPNDPAILDAIVPTEASPNRDGFAS